MAAPAAAKPAQTVRKRPFTWAAHQHTEYGGLDTTVTPSAVTQVLTADIPATGYLRNLCILITTQTAGTGGTGLADFPFNLLQELTLNDVNGAPIFGPLDGYSAYLAQLCGGYAFRQDTKLQPNYSATTTAPTFMLRMPLEINENDGFGAISNMNSSQNYRVRIVFNTLTGAYSVSPSPVPLLRIRVWIEAWTRPADASQSGAPQEVAPPFHGVSQFWTKVTKPTVAGENYIAVPKVGNLIRALVFVFRDGTGVRTDAQAGTALGLLELRLDQRVLQQTPFDLLKTQFAEGAVLTAAPDAGVAPFLFNDDELGHIGNGTQQLYLPTLQSSRLELRVPSALAGSIDILTNDVARVAVDPNERYSFEGGTGFQANPDASQFAANH